MASYNPQSTYNPQGSSPYLQGSSPVLQASPSSGLRVQPAYQPNLNTTPVGGHPVPIAYNGTPPVATYTSNGSNSTGASTGGTTYTAPPPDPYAQWGGRAAYNSLVSGFDTQHNNIFGTATDAVGAAGSSLHSSILDFLDSLRSGQQKIDNSAVQNELAKKQGAQGVLGMVGRGIRSGGVLLGNKNAGDSSAVGALAGAYGDLGRRQLSTVNNQYIQGQDKITTAQNDLNVQRASGQRHIGDSKTQVINGIVTQARNQLAALDGQIAGANLPNRINIEAEKEKVRQQALSSLQQYDQELTNGLGGINPASADQNRSKALQMFSAGTAPENAFSFTDQFPAQFQGTGPTAGELPLFTLPKGSKQQEFA